MTEESITTLIVVALFYGSVFFDTRNAVFSEIVYFIRPALFFINTQQIHLLLSLLLFYACENRLDGHSER